MVPEQYVTKSLKVRMHQVKEQKCRQLLGLCSSLSPTVTPLLPEHLVWPSWGGGEFRTGQKLSASSALQVCLPSCQESTQICSICSGVVTGGLWEEWCKWSKGQVSHRSVLHLKVNMSCLGNNLLSSILPICFLMLEREHSFPTAWFWPSQTGWPRASGTIHNFYWCSITDVHHSCS